METLEKQLEEEKQKVQLAGSHRGAATGEGLGSLVLHKKDAENRGHRKQNLSSVLLQLPGVTWRDCGEGQIN